MRRSLLASKRYAEAKSYQQRKNIERQFRKRALRELVDLDQQELFSSITMEDNEIPREHIYKRATTFNKRLLDMSLIDIDPNTSPGDGDAFRANIDLDQPFGAKTGSDGDIPDVDDTESRLVIDDAQVEPDADELFVTQDEDDGTEMELPEEHGVSSALLDFTSATGKISYVEAVQQAMRLLLTNELSEDGGCE